MYTGHTLYIYSGSTASLTSFEYDYSKPQSLEAGEGYKVVVPSQLGVD